MIFPLSRPAAAEGLVDALSDVDAVEYYSTSPVARSTLFYQLFGVRFSGQLNNLSLDGVSASNMTFADNLRSLLTALNGVYSTTQSLSSRITALENSSSGLDFWLERIDTNTQGLHGDLLNIQQALGWVGSSSPTIWSLLNALISSTHQDLLDVMSRQDAAQMWLETLWSNEPLSTHYISNGSIVSNQTSNLRQLFSNLSSLTTRALFINKGVGSYLDWDGSYGSSNGLYLSEMLRLGLLGLHANLTGLDNSGSYSAWRGPDQTAVRSANNLLDMLSFLGADLQAPLAKLQYVWASDDDIRIVDKNQPVKDEIEENFVGDGGSAVKPSDIGDVASIGSSVKDTFSGAGSYSDIFSTLCDGANFGFFSQEVANILEPPVPSSVSDGSSVDVDALMSDDPEFWGQFNIDENGFCTPCSSLFDVSSYLEGVS